MSKEITIEDIEYFGHEGYIIGEFEPLIEDMSFSAHNGAGNLETFGGSEITGFAVFNGVFYPYDGLNSFVLSNEEAYSLVEDKEDEILKNFDVMEYL